MKISNEQKASGSNEKIVDNKGQQQKQKQKPQEQQAQKQYSNAKEKYKS
jgi:hypothetical protein